MAKKIQKELEDLAKTIRDLSRFFSWSPTTEIGMRKIVGRLHVLQERGTALVALENLPRMPQDLSKKHSGSWGSIAKTDELRILRDRCEQIVDSALHELKTLGLQPGMEDSGRKETGKSTDSSERLWGINLPLIMIPANRREVGYFILGLAVGLFIAWGWIRFF